MKCGVRCLLGGLLCCVAGGLFAADTYTNSDAGFKIDVPKGFNGMGLAVHFFLPETEVFTDNVNVLVDEAVDNFPMVGEALRAQFEKRGAVVIRMEAHENEITTEFTTNEPDGKKLHYYQRIVNEKKLYVITATGLDSRWKTNSKVLTEAVDSFVATKK
jgi:hypothetical protein